MYEQIPVEIIEQHAGKWIIWDQHDKKVIASAVTLDEAEDQAALVKTDHLLRIHHVLPIGEEIVVML